MTTGRYRRSIVPLRQTGARRIPNEENFFFFMIGCSVVIHIIAAAIFSHTPPSPIQHRTPPLYVDLVMAPVNNPRRGSGSGAEPVVIKPAAQIKPTLPIKVPKDVAVANHSTQIKAKKDKKTPSIEDELQDDFKKYRENRQQQESLRAAEADTRRFREKVQKQAATTSSKGVVQGSGVEVGGDIKKWIFDEFRARWKLSRYQIKNPNLRVTLIVEYDKNGTLINPTNPKVEWSGDRTFDDTIRKAFVSFSKEKLPATYLTNLQTTFSDKIILTPKDLFEK